MFTRSPFTPYDDSPCDKDERDVEMIRVGRWPAEPVEWLWPNRIPIGKVTLLVGDPGLGKSLVALDIAARVSRGTAWPEEQVESQETRVKSQNADSGSPLSTLDSRLPASVLILSAEDDLRDTIRPRLDAAGADCNRVFLIPSIANLRDDFQQLEAAVNRARDCRLIIIDPINAYVGSGDCHFHTVVHKVLAPLAKLAHERRIAVLAIAHVRKSEGAAIFRATGSAGFVCGARAVWTVCRDPDNPARQLFLPLKTNVAGASAARGLAYTVEPHPKLSGPKLVWDATLLTITTAAALKPRKPTPPPSPERTAARDWLRETLAAGPRSAREILSEGERRGFLERTLRRAFHEMSGHSAKQGLLEGWWWSLNDQSAEEDSVDPSEIAVPFEAVTYESDIAAQQQFNELVPRYPIPAPLPIARDCSFPPTLDRSKAVLDRLRKERRVDADNSPPGENSQPAHRARPAPKVSKPASKSTPATRSDVLATKLLFSELANAITATRDTS